MSTTATITLYPSVASAIGAGVAACAAVAVGSAAIAYYLLRPTAEEREALLTKRKQEILQNQRIPLTLTSLASLIQRAEELGYKKSPLSQKDGLPAVRLENLSTGQKMELFTDKETGKVEAIAPIPVIDSVVRHYATRQAIEHLTSRGMEVKVKKSKTGEIQIKGVSKKIAGGTREGITADIRKNGTIDIDVNGVKGNSCEKMAIDLARAIGGEFIGKPKRKKEYYETPLRNKRYVTT